MMLFVWQAQGFRALWHRYLKPPTLNPWKDCNFILWKYDFAGIISCGSYRSLYASAQLFRGSHNIFEASIYKSLKRIVILRPSVLSTCHF